MDTFATPEVDSVEPSVLHRFFVACHDGKFDELDKLIDQVDVNSQASHSDRHVQEFFFYPSGFTGMMLACMSNQSWITEPCNPKFAEEYPNKSWAIDVVHKLIVHGADVDLEEEQGRNCLDYVLASTPFRPQLAALLRLFSKHEMSSRGYDYLICCHSIEAVQFCLENGVDVNSVSSKYNFTVMDFIHICFQEYDPIWLPYLVSQGAKRYRDLVPI